MKKLSLIFLISLCSGLVKAQIADTIKPVSHKLSADFLFKKSRNQNIIAWILLGAGAGLGIAGLAVGEGAVKRVWSDPVDTTLSTVSTGGALALVGGASMLASIPFFIASGKNRRKASVMLKDESVSFSRQLHFSKSFISLGISVNL
ncbi:MAG: hypothetical protein ABI691_19880 [Ginsengibacter sp.]